MLKSKISYLVLSDIHLGHDRTPTKYIVANLLAFFAANDKLLRKLDILFLAGDVYDKLLSSSSEEFITGNEWLSLLARYCSKHKIKLRVLEGTPSHDWKQLAVFSKMIDTLGLDLDYKYIDELSIEHMDDLGIHVLYVPDEWNHAAEETYIETTELMTKHGIDKVDIAIMHGQFSYQLPMVELPSSHDVDKYLDIVRYYINIGHIHTSSVFKRILAQGSFDRLAHNEEEDKGGMLMTIYHTGDMEFLFLKNKNAYPYKQFDVSEMDASGVAKFIDKALTKLPLGTRVKIIIANNEVNKLLKPIQSKYKDLFFTIQKKKAVVEPVIKNNRIEITPFEITRNNVEELLLNELSKYNLAPNEVDIIKAELSDVI